MSAVLVSRSNGLRSRITAVSYDHEPYMGVEISTAGIDLEIRVNDHGEVAGTYCTIEAWREINQQVEKMHAQHLQAIAKSAKRE